MSREATPRRQNARAAPGGSARFARQRERIIDAATGLLNRKGVRGMTLLEVAQALDLTATSVTYYFRYKEQLAAAVFEDSLDRLMAMVAEAGRAPTPRARVAAYIGLHVDLFGRALRGEARPLAILSEIRALEDETRKRLIGRYQEVLRGVRGFFGPIDGDARRWLCTARAHLLNEALFWAVVWLGKYPVGDFANIRRRLLAILDGGIATRPSDGWGVPLDPDAAGAGAAEPAGRADFLRVATRLINDIGYKGASVDRIMGELNLTKGSFYHHLDGKDDLVLACSRNSYRRLARLQALADREGAPWRRLSSGIASALAIQFRGDYPFLRSTALQAMPAPVRDVAVEQAGRTELWLAGMLVDGMEEGAVRTLDPLIASHLITSTINSAYDLRSWAAKRPMAESVEVYMDLLISGIFDPE